MSTSTAADANQGLSRFHSLDLLSTLIAVLRADGAVQFANAALENTLGLSRRTLEGADFSAFFTDPALLQTALTGAKVQDFAALRFEASLRRPTQDPVPVHVNVAASERMGEMLVELWPLEQQARQDREERLREQALANKELIRNLAHEIKNPLGGIRGAAQLLEMELESRDLKEYTQVIIHEADRLQSLVDRECQRFFRHAVPESVNMLIDERRRTDPTITKLGSDMSVPNARLADVIALYRRTLAESGLESAAWGHIGNNHLHVNILPRDAQDYRRGGELFAQWAAEVTAMGGAVSAEHGVGKIKAGFLETMYGHEAMVESARLKLQLDPDGQLGRGNLFSEKLLDELVQKGSA